MQQRPINILMADDDFEDMELIEDAFVRQEPSISLQKLTNGRAVIDYLANQPDDQLPCLIILDYNMPELTGSEVLAQICLMTRYKNIPKVILSTSSTSAHIHECKINGATEYFVKPDNLNDMNKLALRMLSFCKK